MRHKRMAGVRIGGGGSEFGRRRLHDDQKRGERMPRDGAATLLIPADPVGSGRGFDGTAASAGGERVSGSTSGWVKVFLLPFGRWRRSYASVKSRLYDAEALWLSRTAEHIDTGTFGQRSQ